MSHSAVALPAEHVHLVGIVAGRFVQLCGLGSTGKKPKPPSPLFGKDLFHVNLRSGKVAPYGFPETSRGLGFTGLRGLYRVAGLIGSGVDRFEDCVGFIGFIGFRVYRLGLIGLGFGGLGFRV